MGKAAVSEQANDHFRGAVIQNLIDHIPTAVCIFQNSGGNFLCLGVNQRYARMVGVSKRFLVDESYENFLKRVHPEDRDKGIGRLDQLTQNDSETGYFCRIFQAQKQSYSWMKIETEIYPQGAAGDLVFMSFTDMTALMQAESALNQNLMMFESIIRQIPGGVMIYSADSRAKFSFVSEKLLALLDLSKEEFNGRYHAFPQMIYETDRYRVLQEINEQIAAAGREDCRYRIRRKDGSLIWVHDSGHLITDAKGKRWFYAILSDVTEEQAAVEHLPLQNLRFQDAIERLPADIIVYRCRQDGCSVAAVNQNACAEFGRTQAEFSAMNQEQLFSQIHPDDQARVQSCLQVLRQKTHAMGEITYRIGSQGKWYRCTATAVPDNKDDSVLIYAVYSDVTVQKAKETEFSQIIQQVLTANSDFLATFRLNLTKNQCCEAAGLAEGMQDLSAAVSADQLLEKIACGMADATEADAFRRRECREQMMQRFAQGEYRWATTYQMLTGSGDSRWVTATFHLFANPYTQDIEAIVYLADADHLCKQKEIVNALTNDEYDFIGLIDLASGMVEDYYVSDQEDAEKIHAGKTLYEDRVKRISEQILSAKEQEQYLRAAALPNVIAVLAKQPVFLYAYSYENSRGEHLRKQVRFRYLENNHQQIMFTRSDVTEAFRHEENYMEQLRQALLYAEKANEMKSGFLGNVSHDIRTPLNAILGYEHLALHTEDPAVKDDCLHKIETAGNTLLSLINDTLDLQKIETGASEIKVAPIHSSSLIQDIAASVQPLMDRKHIHFIINTEKAAMAAILADQTRMQEIFINLLSNAAKFTPEGGTVELTMVCLKKNAKTISEKITVKDNGVGMTKEFQERMYEPFSQERNAKTASIGGSGLGLTIVRRLVEQMGGTIDCDSRIGRGTQFTVHLTFDRASEELAGKEEIPLQEADISGLHILLCEDNAMNTEIARRILIMNHATVDTAADGSIGLQKFLASGKMQYDVILMDIRMPNMDGYTAAKAIRESSHPRGKTIPILAMSADAYASDVEKALNSGMNAHLAKPIDPRKMIAEISRVHQEEEAAEGHSTAESGQLSINH